MSDRIYNATALELMTNEIEGRTENESAGVVLDWLEENDYDAAPIFRADSGEAIGYVEQSRIEDREVNIRVYIENFTISNLISSSAGFSEILSNLRQRYFYFLGGADELNGILTRADLNKPAAYIHLYERITLFEDLLRNYFSEWEEDWKSYLKNGAIGQIEGRREKHSDLSLDHVYYANFSHLTTVIWKSELYRKLGFDSGEDARDFFDELDSLRNDVAHRKLILEIDQIDTNSSARDITDIDAVYSKLEEVNERLEFLSTDTESTVFQQRTTSGKKLRQMYAGTCQVCGSQSPEDESFTEMCHIVSLNKGGKDSAENMLVLCPNHHRQFDRGDLILNPDELTIQSAPDDQYVGQKIILIGNHEPSSEFLRRHNSGV